MTSTKPWMQLRGRPGVWTGDPLAPVIEVADVEALR